MAPRLVVVALSKKDLDEEGGGKEEPAMPMKGGGEGRGGAIMVAAPAEVGRRVLPRERGRPLGPAPGMWGDAVWLLWFRVNAPGVRSSVCG